MAGGKMRWVIALVLVIGSVITYFNSRSDNPVTGETQHVSMTPDQEIAMGLQAAPQMAQQFGGLDPDPQKQAIVDQIGQELVQKSAAGQTPYRFEFHLLADPNTVNAFALPGGQIFITDALYDRLTTKDQLAGVLGHEIGHVVGRHSAEQLAKAKLTEGLTGAAVIATYDPGNPRSTGTAAMAAMVGKMINMKFGRDDELQSDDLGVRFMVNTGYDPNAMIEVMEILAEASGGGSRQPEFFSTHPNPDNRIARIKEAIKKYGKSAGSY